MGGISRLIPMHKCVSPSPFVRQRYWNLCIIHDMCIFLFPGGKLELVRLTGFKHKVSVTMLLILLTVNSKEARIFHFIECTNTFIQNYHAGELSKEKQSSSYSNAIINFYENGWTLEIGNEIFLPCFNARINSFDFCSMYEMYAICSKK